MPKDRYIKDKKIELKKLKPFTDQCKKKNSKRHIKLDPAPMVKSRKSRLDGFWNSECPPDTPVDSELVETMSREELGISRFEDKVLSDDEEIVPLSRYPIEVQEEFWKNVDKTTRISDNLQEEFNAELACHFKDGEIGSPIFLLTGHSSLHKSIKVPKHWTNHIKGMTLGDDIDPYKFLSDNEKFHLFKSRKYDIVENYLAPMIFSNKKEVFTTDLMEVDDEMYSKISKRTDGIERLKIKLNKDENEDIFCMCYPVEARGLLYICIACSPKMIPHPSLNKKKYHPVTVENVEERKEFFNLRIGYLFHFYFSCDCRRDYKN